MPTTMRLCASPKMLSGSGLSMGRTWVLTLPTTGLRREEAMTFVKFSPIIWRWLLGLIASFIKWKGSLAAVIPEVDHPRVAQFVQLWYSTEPPGWLRDVLVVLDGKWVDQGNY